MSLLPHVFVVANSVPATTVAEFIAHAKANPGKLNYGAGLGTPPHLLSTLFKEKAGIDIVYIPYKGSRPVDHGSARRPHADDDRRPHRSLSAHQGRQSAAAGGGKGRTRWPELPEVPTLVESGFPDFVADAWTGVVAPIGTPPEIIIKLNTAINEGVQSAEMKANLARFSAIPKAGSPQDFAAFLGEEIPKWAAIVKLSGAKVE